MLDHEADKNTYEVQVSVSDGKDFDGSADTAVDATITVNIAVTNVNEGAPPSVDFTLSEVRATTVLVTVTPPDTTGTSPIERYVLSYAKASAPNVFEVAVIESGTTVTFTGLTPGTTYTIRLLARNMDGENGPVTTKTVTTGANTAPTSANFTKKVSRHAGAIFSASDFPFTDVDTGDSLSKVKIVTLPDGTADGNGKRKGELRFDGTAVTADQEVSAADLGKLKYVPQPDGFRLDIGSSFTFKVLDRAGAESPTYTVTLEQIPDIVLSLSRSSITESSTPSAGGRVAVTGTLTGPTRTDDIVIPQIRVNIVHDARENSDYTVNPNQRQLRIPAGQKGATLTFDFTGIEDNLVEGDEEISFYADWAVNGIVPRGSVTERVGRAFLTLEDNDRAVVSITGPPGEVEEGEDAVFTVRLSRGITVPLSVAWSASAGTASAGDFVGSSGTVNFPAGSPDNATQTITIPVIDDLVPEPTERFSVALGAITGKAASQVSIESGKGTANADIAESDAVTVSISGDERVTEGDSATYTISLDSAESTSAITVDYTTTDETALAGTDYTAASGTVTIAAGQTSATVTVATTENTDDEANRYFEFRMSNPQGGGGPKPMLSTTQFVDTNIVDDDGDPSSIVLSVDKTSFGEADTAGMVNVTATLEGGTLTENAIVEVTLGGSATKGSSGDYTATTLGNITITGGESSGTASFTVTPVSDVVVEGDETIELEGAAAAMDITPATITITDDDTATLGITGPAGVVVEGSSAEFTVTLSHAVASQVVVAWSAGSTAETPASADDYSPDSGVVVFPAGSAAGATKTITMVIADDGADEEMETFTVTLGSVSGDLASRVSVDSAKSSADASIATGEIVTVTLLGPRAFAHVTSNNSAVYHVLLSGPVNADIQVDIATADGTATGCRSTFNSCIAGQEGDYGIVSRTLTIGPSKDTQDNQNKLGVTWDKVLVSFTDHPREDPDETFTISLSNLRGGGTTPVVLGNSSVTTTIKSTPLAFSVSGPEFVDEGTKARFIVTRNVDLEAGMGARVSYATSDGTATADSDYTAASGTLEIPTPTLNPPTIEEIQRRYSDWEVLVPVTADNMNESGETFSLTLSSPQTFSAGYSGMTAAALGTETFTTTIRDRAMVVSVSGPETVVEGEYADFTVSLSRAPTANLTVSYQTYGALAPAPLATSGEDFTAQSGTLTFVPGETSKRVRVPVLTDAITEPVEYFRLLIANPSGGGGLRPSLGTSEATMGIVDAAGRLYGATLTVEPDSGIDEGDGTATNFTVKVALDCCTSFDYPIPVTVTLGGTATETQDYTATVATVTIPASTAMASASLSITPVEDAAQEGDETIVVNGSGAGLLILPATITLKDNDAGRPAAPTVTATEFSVPWDPALDVSWEAISSSGLTTVGYQVRYRKQGDSGWTPHADALSPSNRSINLPNLEEGATYEVQVRAVVERPRQSDITLSLSRSSFEESSFDADSRGDRVRITATRQGTSGDVFVDLTLSGTATGSGIDYRSRTLTDIRIADGSTSGYSDFTFTGINDADVEGSESIVVYGEVAGLTVESAVITIIDDEWPGPVFTSAGREFSPWSYSGTGTVFDPAAITLSFNPDYVQEGQSAVQVVLTATRDTTAGDHTVAWSVAGLTQTATDGTDYNEAGRWVLRHRTGLLHKCPSHGCAHRAGRVQRIDDRDLPHLLRRPG